MARKQTKKPTRSPAVKQPGTRHAAAFIALRPIWEQRLKELEAFKKEHGHCNVPSRYSPNQPLATWVANVRHRKKSGKHALELIRRLDGLGFIWRLRRRAVFRWDWDAMVAALAAFKKEHGHCRVPSQLAKYRALGMWLTEVRRRKRKGRLDRGRIRELDRLGVVWEPREREWEDRFAELVAYRAKYGDCNVPGGRAENARLASWVHTQRHRRKLGTLTQDHLERLDRIGFVWTMVEDAWESKYAALVEYQRTHGHCWVSTLSKDHASLGNWVRTQRGRRRRGSLREDRIELLDRLGFLWDMPRRATDEKTRARISRTLKRKGKVQWDAAYLRLAQYRQKHGHCRVPLSQEHAYLARWIFGQRWARSRGELSQEQVQRLDKLGFVWNSWEERWQRMLEILAQYKKAHGNCNVPEKWPEDRKLAAWVQTQRNYNKKGKLSPQHKERLEALGFQWSMNSPFRSLD
jgi:hypothetical protein